MPDTLAGLVRAKFPGQYDDLDDAALEAKVLAKYPQYKDLVKAHDASRSWTDTAVDVLPAVGGAAGGILGGIGGTVAGLGVGGVPGAIGGAAIGGAGGEAARQLINTMRGRPQASSSEAALGIAGQAALQGTMEGVGGVVAPIASRAGQALMQGAVKPNAKASAQALVRGSDLPIVKTLLDEGVNVTTAGIEKLSNIISASNQAIRDALSSVPASVTLDPAIAASRTVGTAAKFARQVNAGEDVAAVRGVARQFMAENPSALTLQEAQAIKQGTYRALKDQAYAPGGMKPAAVEAQKAIARGLKEDISAEAAKYGTDLTALNAREGAAITAREAVAKRIAVAGNRDPVALAWLAHNPVTGLAFLMERSPAVKSMLARGLYQSAAIAARVPGLTPNMIRLMVTSVAEGAEPQEQ